MLFQDDLLPAADRVKYHIDKKGQNSIDKEALTKWMEEAAIASQIGQDYIPYVKEAKGKGMLLYVKDTKDQGISTYLTGQHLLYFEINLVNLVNFPVCR